MRAITATTLNEFRPDYGPVRPRRAEVVKEIGVLSPRKLKNFMSQIERWNRESAVGWSAAEAEILALVIGEEEQNPRFGGNAFIRREHGGNGGEHPVFIGLQVDAARDAAGYGPEAFNPANPETLYAAQLSQRLHTMVALHDVGELVDISLSDVQALSGKKKEPDEEAWVGPFKLKLAAYALAQGNPKLYTRTLDAARQRIETLKPRLFAIAANLNGEVIDEAAEPELVTVLKAQLGKRYQPGQPVRLTSDEFVDAVGKAIGIILTEAQTSLHIDDAALGTVYGPACHSLSNVFDSTQQFKGNFEGELFTLFDKLEGDAHFRHFAGHMPEAPTRRTPLTERLFQKGEALSLQAGSSLQILKNISYAQGCIPAVLETAAAMPEGPERRVAERFARAGAAALIANHIRLLQKAAPYIDADMKTPDNKNPALSADDRVQVQGTAQKLGQQALLAHEYRALGKDTRETITDIRGAEKTEVLIAALDKAAELIRDGHFTPTAADLPLPLGTLPDALQMSAEEVRERAARHPADAFMQVVARR